MINTDYPNELRAALVSAVQVSFADCSDRHERYIAGNCVIEFLSALSMGDEEISQCFRMRREMQLKLMITSMR